MGLPSLSALRKQFFFPSIFRDLSTSFNSSAKQMQSTLGHCFKAQPQLKAAAPLCIRPEWKESFCN